MKHTCLFVFFFFLFLNIYAQVKIGSNGNPNANAVLELDGGTSKGLLMPRLTSSQMTAISSAPDGLMIFNTTDNALYIRKLSAWQKVADASSGPGEFTLPYGGSASTTSPLFSVTNYQASGGGDAIQGWATSGDGITGVSTNGNGGYFSSTSGAALVTLSGNVGIGTNSPGYQLDVNGRMRIRYNNNANAGLWFNKSDNTEGAFTGMANDSVVGFFGNGTAGGWKMGMDMKNTRLGVGNITPAAPLGFANTNGNKVDLYYGSVNSRYGFGIQSSLMQLYSGSVSDDIAFGYGSSTAFTENMRIKGNGNVGIGITSPSAKLDIRSSSSSYGLYVGKTGDGVGLGVSSNSTSSAVYAFNSNGPALIADGRVGINATSPAYMLDIGGRIRLRNEGPNSTAGLWLDGPTSANRSFIGTFNQNQMGIYGISSGWGFLHDITTGNTGMGIGENTPNSKLQLGGSVSMPFIEVSDNYTVTDNDYAIRIVINQNTNISKTITLPPASGRTGRVYKIMASIIRSGPAPWGSYTASEVLVKEAGTNINVILADPAFSNISISSLQNTIYTDGQGKEIKVKLTAVTVQSNGSSWKIIEENL